LLYSQNQNRDAKQTNESRPKIADYASYAQQTNESRPKIADYASYAQQSNKSKLKIADYVSTNSKIKLCATLGISFIVVFHFITYTLRVAERKMARH
jgi:hypothetical protein